MQKIEKALREAGIESPRFEARQLYEYIKENNLQEETEAIIARRAAGEPLQYILGEWEFYSLPFYVGEGVLIPRPDTETLCELAIDFIGDRPLRVIDLCSGSGCIAISVAENCHSCEMTAVEKSSEAFSFLERNIKRNASRVKAVNADIFDIENGNFDVILSNPPYIPTKDCETLQKEVLLEPKMALDGGEDGLFFYREILKTWLPRLNAGGLLAVEVGFDQAEAVKSLFLEAGLKNVSGKRDLSGVERVIFGTLIGL